MVFYQDREIISSSRDIILSGGYSGHANFGDILQLKSVISWYKSLEYNPIVIIRLDAIYDELFIEYLYSSFDVKAFIFYSPTIMDVSQYSLKISKTFICNRFHLYGGGMINSLWAKDIIGLCEAIINRFQIKKYIISGQQIDSFGANLLKNHFDRFSPAIVGVRDRESQEYLSQNDIDSIYSFDDAYEELNRLKNYFLPMELYQKEIYLHLNLSPYVSDDLLKYINDFKSEVVKLKKQYPQAKYKLLLTYQDSRILSIVDTPTAIATLDYHMDMDEMSILNLASMAQKKEPSKIYDIDKNAIVLATSYHTAMFMQMLGLNVYMFANNEYYQQKRKGLALDFTSVDDMMSQKSRVKELDTERRDSRKRWFKRLTVALDSEQNITPDSFNEVYPKSSMLFRHKPIHTNLENFVASMGVKKPKSTKVFGIGWAKTGTTSLGKALVNLGYRHKSQDFTLVDDLMCGNYGAINQVIQAHDSFDDWPWIVMFKQLDAMYENSKFILTVRDSDSWLKSYRNMLLNESSDEYTNKTRSFLYGLNFPDVSDKELLSRYKYHIEEVKSYFNHRPNDLLILDWSKGDGWEKLCKFLNKKVPNSPFPHENKGKYN